MSVLFFFLVQILAKHLCISVNLLKLKKKVAYMLAHYKLTLMLKPNMFLLKNGWVYQQA